MRDGEGCVIIISIFIILITIYAFYAEYIDIQLKKAIIQEINHNDYTQRER